MFCGDVYPVDRRLMMILLVNVATWANMVDINNVLFFVEPEYHSQTTKIQCLRYPLHSPDIWMTPEISVGLSSSCLSAFLILPLLADGSF
jgi:hypothetical protein